MSEQDTAVLVVEELRVSLKEPGEGEGLLSGISFEVGNSEVLGLVGGSGSGKSLTIRACMNLLPEELRAEGSVKFRGTELQTLGSKYMADYRARDFGLVHQDARSSMNPRRTVGDFILESVLHSRMLSFDEAFHSACALLRDVGISNPEARMRQFPNELSGGTLQRMMIVAALLHNPKLIYADEPTSALDVIAQSDVMAILLEQVRDRGMALLLITHDLDLAAASCDQIAVMHAGQIVESGPAGVITSHPQHGYTRRLLEARQGTALPGNPEPTSNSDVTKWTN